MAVQSDLSLDSGPCVVDNPYKSEMFWERFHRRQEPVTRRVYSSVRWSCDKDLLESLHLKPKKLIMNYLGQEEKAPKEEISEADDNLVHETPPHSSQENEKWVPTCLWTRKREDTVLRKHLCRTRQHIRAVKHGCGYFHLLLKEEQEAQEEQRRERQRREELRRTEPRAPTLFDSDEDSDTERWCDVAAASSSEWKTNRRKMRAARPFTPVHRSLISTPPHLLPGEYVYRQLCCLNWLLEALTQERSGRFEPVTSCWDAKDPGRSRTTIKRLNKEKAIEAKWEQFIAPPKQSRPLTSKPLRVSSGSHLTWKTSALSVLSSSVTGSSVGSLLSLATAPEHICDEPVYTKGIENREKSVQESESDSSSSEYLQKCLQELSFFKTCCNTENQLASDPDSKTGKVYPESKQNTDGEKTESQRAKSCPVNLTSATTQLIHEKKAMLDEITASFVHKAEELTLNLSDALDRCANKRWDFGVQRYRSLCNMVSGGRIPSAVTSITSLASPRAQDSKIPDSTEDPYSTQWLSVLLSNLAHIKHSDRRVARLLEKLRRFTECHTLRLHPHNFLRILNSLQLWELCCPDLCVAIEIVRQNVVKMPKAEYDSWLRNRVSQSQITKSATYNL